MIRVGSLLIIILFLTGCGQKHDRFAVVDQMIDELGAVLAPDKRVEVVEVVKVVEEGKLVIKGVTTLPEFRDLLWQKLDSAGLSGEFKDSIVLLPDPLLGEKNWALVNVSVCNIRTHPGHSQELTTQAVMGTPLRVLQERNGWFRIQTPDHYIAWIDEAAIHRMNTDEIAQWKKSAKVIFNEDFGLVYSVDNPETVVSDLTMGCLMQSIRSLGPDIIVALPDGRTGRVAQKSVTSFDLYINQSYPDFERIFKVAHTFIGRPYLWGGTSPRGMDCSGFMKTLFFSQGVILARDANQQVKQGEEISLENDLALLEPGDLLFFGRKATAERGERVSHVGLYLGNGHFIHSSGRVKVNSFKEGDADYSKYLKDILLHARRVTLADMEQGPWTVKNHQWYK